MKYAVALEFLIDADNDAEAIEQTRAIGREANLPPGWFMGIPMLEARASEDEVWQDPGWGPRMDSEA